MKEVQMHSIRSILAVTAAVTGAVLVFAATVLPAAAQDSKMLTVTKTCGHGDVASGELPYCLITASNFPKLVNAKIRYFGPLPGAGHLFLDSPVMIEGTGGTAFGHCLVRVLPAVLGACEFTGGSGSLAGFKGDVTVTVDTATGIWSWNGIRYVAD
jgi:hypothetical protein